MKRFVRASVLALAMIGVFSVGAVAQGREFSTEYGETHATAAIDIARIKSVLKLTPAQEPYWAPVEVALRDLARQQAPAAESSGIVRRIGHRVVSIVLNSAAVHRLVVAARPLIAKLDEEQIRAAHGLAQEMGLGPVVAALK